MTKPKMLEKNVEKRQSEVLNGLRIPATIMVIVSHCLLITEPLVLPFAFSADNLFLILESWFWSFGGIAVPLFAFISGYYFFYKRTKFTVQDYKIEIKKRAKSLLLPYVLWNLIAWFALYAKNRLALEFDFSPGFNTLEYTLITERSLIDLLMLPLDSPLWYIQSLIALSIISPIIYLSIRYIKYLSLAIVLALYLGIIPSDLGLHLSTLMYFYLGSFLGYHKKDVLYICGKVKVFAYVAALSYFYYRIFGGDVFWLQKFSPLLLLTCVISLINISNYVYIYRRRMFNWVIQFNPASFFMYALHYIIVINLIRGTSYAVIPWDNSWEKIVTLLILIVSVPCITYYVYCLFAFISPKATQILSGGRG